MIQRACPHCLACYPSFAVSIFSVAHQKILKPFAYFRRRAFARSANSNLLIWSNLTIRMRTRT